jgi:hypothetical protein
MIDSGVSNYVKGTATVETWFPVDRTGSVDLCCDKCNFYSFRDRRCWLTQELPPYPNKYRGRECPLDLSEE